MPWPSQDPDNGVPMGVLLVGWLFGVVLAAAVRVKIDLGPLWVVIPGVTALTTAGWWRRTHAPLEITAAAPQRQGFWPSKDPEDYRGRDGGAGHPVPALPLVIGWSGGQLLAWGFTASSYSPLALAAGFALLTISVGAAIVWRVRRD